MSAYRKKWIEALKDRQVEGWDIDIHGQAIVIKVAEEDLDTVKKKALAIINELSPAIQMPAEWLKFIFYNDKLRFQHIINADQEPLK
jgi:hypothetical protein